MRKYTLLFFPMDNSIQIRDNKTHKLFLKRTHYPDVNEKDLYIGSVLNIYARQMKIVEYSDQETKFQFDK